MEPGVLSRTPLKIPHFSGGIQSGLLGCLLGFACALAFPLGLGGALVQVLALETCAALVAFGVLVGWKPRTLVRGASRDLCLGCLHLAMWQSAIHGHP